MNAMPVLNAVEPIFGPRKNLSRSVDSRAFMFAGHIMLTKGAFLFA
jgi:hypothetical protein